MNDGLESLPNKRYGGLECRVVLVGDPQQLPATILSQRGKDLMFDRSLFERLQTAGCPVHTLQVQYRMHPFIREFPSRYFYENSLKDGSASCANLLPTSPTCLSDSPCKRSLTASEP